MQTRWIFALDPGALFAGFAGSAACVALDGCCASLMRGF